MSGSYTARSLSREKREVLHFVPQPVIAFAVPPSSSWQPALSLGPLYALHLHYTSGLRSCLAQHLSFLSGSIRFSHPKSTGCQLFARLRVAPGCVAVMVFECLRSFRLFILVLGSGTISLISIKNPASPLLQAVAIQQTAFSLSATGGSTRNGFARKPKWPQ